MTTQDGTAEASADSDGAPTRVLVYSDDVTVRDAVRRAVGQRPDPALPTVELVDFATEPAVVAAMDRGGFDLVILDGEAVPAGGMGICRQLKDEIHYCPPVIVLTARRDDAWLATWSRADAAVQQPIDPRLMVRTVTELLRARLIAFGRLTA